MSQPAGLLSTVPPMLPLLGESLLPLNTGQEKQPGSVLPSQHRTTDVRLIDHHNEQGPKNLKDFQPQIKDGKSSTCHCNKA